MKDCDTCLNKKEPSDCDYCDRCLNDPRGRTGWVYEHTAETFERIALLAKAVEELATSKMAVKSIRAYCGEIIIRLNDLEGRG